MDVSRFWFEQVKEVAILLLYICQMYLVYSHGCKKVAQAPVSVIKY